MHQLYAFLVGPLMWAVMIVFVGGLAWRFVSMTKLAMRKDPYVFHYMQSKYVLRSFGAWLIPFFTRSMRVQPGITIVGFLFHIAVIITPIFLLAHVILWEEGIGLSLWTLPEGVADALTLVVLGSIVYFAVRRMTQAHVRYVTDWTDYAILIMVALPFLTGILAHYQIFPYRFMIILHILTGQAALVMIPFSRLSHMLFGPMVRGYMGSEFGGVRHTKDW